MDAFAHFLFILLACFCVLKPAYAVPDNEGETTYMHTLELDISEMFLLNLIQSNKGYLSEDNLNTVVIRIMSQYKIHLDKVDVTFTCLRPLKSKLRRMWTSWTNAKGSRGKSKLVQKFENSTYAFKIPHKTGSPTKRKLAGDVQEGKTKIQKLECDLADAQNDLITYEDELREANRKLGRLSNPTKRVRGERGRTRGKSLYSKSQKRRHKLQKIEVVKDIFRCQELLSLELRNEHGETIQVSMKDDSISKIILPVRDENNVDNLIYIMDSCYITDSGYHEIAQRYPSLPRTHNIIKRRHELNDMFDVKTLEGKFEGLYKSLKTHLIETLSEPSNAHMIKDGKVEIKFSGDGTRAGTKKHMINVSYTIIGDKYCSSERGNYLLAIVQCPETAECIPEALIVLIGEFNDLDHIQVNDKKIKVEKFIGGDLKFLNQVTGIGGFASTYSCLWCKCAKNDRSDTTKTWSMTDASKGARTIEEIADFAKKPKSSKTKYNCTRSPIFPSVPVSRIIPDTLHLFLRIMDQLVYQLTYHLRYMDNCVKLSNTFIVENCDNLMRFQQFIKKIGITDWIFIVRDSKIETRSFTGPEHRRILENIDLELIIPNHAKLGNIKRIWAIFRRLVGQLNCQLTMEQIDEFESSAKAWIDLYCNVYLAKDITPYMHVLAFHIPEVMRLYGNPTYFCQQGLEKLNDLVTKWYFRATNFGKTALKQIMLKQNRLRHLETKCKRAPRWVVKCSSCHQDGHNKATCPVLLNG